jgi:UDP-3-O-acyl-N-acetylglucosamine deacetylase
VDATGQRVEFDIGSGRYKRDIARARTFGFTKDVEMMRARGLGLGGSMDNVIVVDDYRVLNADGLRYDDEFVKHKILDAIGDMHVAGKPLIWRLHRLQGRPCAEQPAAAPAAGRPTAYDIVSFDKQPTRRAAPSWPRPRLAPRPGEHHAGFRLVFGLLLLAGCCALRCTSAPARWCGAGAAS